MKWVERWWTDEDDGTYYISGRYSNQIAVICCLHSGHYALRMESMHLTTQNKIRALLYSLSKTFFFSKDEDWRLVPEHSGHHLLLFLHLCGQLCAWRLHSRGRNHSGKDDMNCRPCIIIKFSLCFAFLCSSSLNCIARQVIIL
jgi:hypothetical protein